MAPVIASGLSDPSLIQERSYINGYVIRLLVV